MSNTEVNISNKGSDYGVAIKSLQVESNRYHEREKRNAVIIGMVKRRFMIPITCRGVECENYPLSHDQT